jgi:hypothetical protein
MTRAKHGETRRNDGFRVADARQVRIEALEKTVKLLKAERDTARLNAERAQREVRALVAANDGLTRQVQSACNVANVEMGAGAALRFERDALRLEVTQLRGALQERSIGLWDRLFGRMA